MLTVVAGSLGAGKTRWIRDQLTAPDSPNSPLYISPVTVGVDACRLRLDVPHLQVEANLAKSMLASENQTMYLELGYPLSLDIPMLAEVPHHRVAVISAHCPTRSHWEQWADEVIINTFPSVDADSNIATDVWQAGLQGQVLDPASLQTFWQELVQGAYGKMMRTKAVLELADGQSIYIDHLPQQETTYQDLPLPKWLDGRPQRFSGIEMIGVGLNKSAIAATLQDCCLTDATLKAHQAALQQSQNYLSQEAA